MIFSIEKEIFLKGLAKIQGIVEKKNTIPILANVLIEAESDYVRLTATDLEVGMKANYPAQVKTQGRITVSAKKLFEIIKELPEKEISFTAKDNCWIEIRCGKALFNIVGLSADEFPYFPQIEKQNFFNISSSILRQMIEKTSFSMSLDETKYNLNGIYVKSIEDKGSQFLRFVATDGHRLSLYQTPIDCSHIEQLIKGVIFPRKGILELRKITEESDTEISIGFMDNNAVIKKEQTIIIMRLVDGEFPDYTRVIPSSNDLKANIPREEFFHALRRMAILSSEKSKGVKIDFEKNHLTLSSSNPEFGDAREDFEIDYPDNNLSIGFNARYLIDILGTLDSEKINLALRDHLSPGLITPADTDDYLAVIMPMRL
ncbi:MULTISPECIES: DNA polymerase III subunit beta [Syntrophotalea]|jgi:DNA polymerase-3 subunit beta|uniref:Beta sliding clamp n=1 Tax=Syntrophotalea acetylenica TaxID=29542 RepID=A0A1L3GFV2_SYNAC|nr:DNA polymerase III subunit beta [Syntrophotalea acetylenica]APG24729.1 DNA polymerase III subunit beta [Syntrophotalea acetylenica]APG42784.1 DNA polymerase III subunit beta [Syntrophotalea acetylenica]MDY0261721.1 DNA polymerase III subunit beta [Syntrophotalea acetylenica]